MKFIKTRLGEISTIGLGCLQSVDAPILSEALRGGTNLFVTAEAYGDDKQKGLSGLAEDKFIVTKVGINLMGATAEENFTFAQRREQIRNSVEKCLTLIGRKTLDLVGLHRLDDIHQATNTNGELVPAWEVALDELINLQTAGLIKHIGLSEPTAAQIIRAVQLAKERGTTIDAVESAYSIVTRRCEENGVKAACEREGIVIMAYTSVIRGLTDARLQQITQRDYDLTNEGFRDKVFGLLGIGDNFFLKNVGMFLLANIKNNVRYMLSFQNCSARYNVTPSQLALAWLQSKGAIPIPGSHNPEHIAENIKSSDLVDELSQKQVFKELDYLFPVGTFIGDPNPTALTGVLDGNSAALNDSKSEAALERDISRAFSMLS